MRLFERFKRQRTEVLEVPVLGFPRYGESWKPDSFDNSAMMRAVREASVTVAPGEHTDEERTLGVLQRQGPRSVVVTLGSEMIGRVPAQDVERVARRIQREGSQIVAAPARFYLHTADEIGRGLNTWTVVVYA